VDLLRKEDIIFNFEKSAYLKKLAELGFQGTEKYLDDIDDPKWL